MRIAGGSGDPHPKVGGKGFVYLDKEGVEVQWFDRDLQEVIKKENAEFFRQAEMKAQQKEHRAKATQLEYEKVNPRVHLDDLSAPALEKYHGFIGGGESAASTAFKRRLHGQGLLEERKGKMLPTGFANLLFAQHPRDYSPEAGLLATIHYDDGTEETKDFDDPLVFIPEKALEWLKGKIPNPIKRSSAQRGEVNEKFYEMVREGIVNALVHRDYDIKGTKCQLVIRPDVIVITSPGRPIKPITVEQLQSFEAPMVSRNPMLHVVFSRMEMAEERGLGLKSMKARASELGLPLPKYSWNDPYLTLTIYRTAEGAVRVVGADSLERLNADEKKTLQTILTKQPMTSAEVMAELKFNERKAQRVLRKLVDEGLVRPVGKGRATQYTATK